MWPLLERETVLLKAMTVVIMVYSGRTLSEKFIKFK